VGASTPELTKLYYRIGEVSHIVGVQPHVLRYWESEFRTIRPRKSSKGQRVYSRRDVEKLLKVKHLLKDEGFTIAGARKQLKDGVTELPTAPPRTSGERVRGALTALRADLVRMIAELNDG
jgi:DNA-binding transcriptional MerR regulator